MGPLGFSVDQLMELAGLSVACSIAAETPQKGKVLVLAGPLSWRNSLSHTSNCVHWHHPPAVCNQHTPSYYVDRLLPIRHAHLLQAPATTEAMGSWQHATFTTLATQYRCSPPPPLPPPDTLQHASTFSDMISWDTLHACGWPSHACLPAHCTPGAEHAPIELQRQAPSIKRVHTHAFSQSMRNYLLCASQRARACGSSVLTVVPYLRCVQCLR